MCYALWYDRNKLYLISRYQTSRNRGSRHFYPCKRKYLVHITLSGKWKNRKVSFNRDRNPVSEEILTVGKCSAFSMGWSNKKTRFRKQRVIYSHKKQIVILWRVWALMRVNHLIFLNCHRLNCLELSSDLLIFSIAARSRRSPAQSPRILPRLCVSETTPAWSVALSNLHGNSVLKSWVRSPRYALKTVPVPLQKRKKQ